MRTSAASWVKMSTSPRASSIRSRSPGALGGAGGLAGLGGLLTPKQAYAQLLESGIDDKSVLARLHESHEITGSLTPAGAGALGLRPGIQVVGGAGDQAEGAVGNGIVNRGVVSAKLGTSGVMFAQSDQPARDPKGRVHTMCHAVAGKCCVFGCMLSAGGSFQWFRNQFGEN